MNPESAISSGSSNEIETATEPFDLAIEGRYIIRTDVHSHILPGLDDGSRSLEMSLEMARIAVSLGVQRMVATPHACHPAQTCDFSAADVRHHVKVLNHALYDHEIPLTVYPGMEFLMDETIPDLMESGHLITWADQGRYILTELGFHDCRACSWEVLDYVQGKGLTPIIAHPERYTWIHDDWRSVDRLEERGCFFQINVMSLNGLWGEPQRAFALEIMRHTKRWLIGTDSHSDHPKFWDFQSIRNLLIAEGLWTGQGEPRVSELNSSNRRSQPHRSNA